MITYKKFIEEHPKGSKELNGINPDNVYEAYYEKVYKRLTIIAEFMSRDIPATEMQLKYALDVSDRKWNVMKNVFPELQEHLDCRTSFMEFKVEMDLQKGMENTEYKNPKMQEMNLQMYSDLYRNRKSKEEVIVKLPDLNITYVDASIDEDVLEEEFSIDLSKQLD